MSTLLTSVGVGWTHNAWENKGKTCKPKAISKTTVCKTKSMDLSRSCFPSREIKVKGYLLQQVFHINDRFRLGGGTIENFCRIRRKVPWCKCLKNECHLYCLTCHGQKKSRRMDLNQNVHKMWTNNLLTVKLVRKNLKVDTQSIAKYVNSES